MCARNGDDRRARLALAAARTAGRRCCAEVIARIDLETLTRELDASIAIDETTRERAGQVCTDFARHENLAIRGRTQRCDVFVLPMRPHA